MHSGGIFQLISYGSQDIYLTNSNHNHNNYPYKIRNNIKKKQYILKEMKFKNFRKNDRYDQRKCVVCLEKFKVDEFVVVRMCRHIYHKDCNDSRIIDCPVCRQ